MTILEKEIWITLNNNHKHYKDIGYDIPIHADSKGIYKAKRGTKLLVNVNDLPLNSNIKITKVCDLCGEITKNTPYFAVLKQRKNNNNKDVCRTCSLKTRLKEKAKANSLGLKYPHIAKEFIELTNTDYKDYTVEMISVSSNQLALWKCSSSDCNCELKTKVSDRTIKSSGCPACSGRIASDKNRLSILYPEIAKQWHPSRNENLTSHDVTYSSHKEIWWKCNYSHEWKTPVYSRTSTKSNCPICSESKGEKRIRKWLEDNKIIFNPQHVFDDLTGLGGKPLSYDFFLLDLNILIEYQGEFHDGNGNNDFTKRNLAKQKEHDKRKKEYSQGKKIDLLEIWYWDFENIENILNYNITIKEHDVIDQRIR